MGVTQADLESLLNPSEDFSTPEKRQAMAQALRRQSGLGMVGQLMGTQPTMAAGGAMQEQAQGSLKAALAKQQAAKEAAIAAEAARQQQEWMQTNYDQRERSIEATRINQAATRAGSGPIIDTPGGKVRVTPENTTTPITDPSGAQVPSTPKPATENQSTLATYAARLEQNLPVVTSLLDKGYLPSKSDFVVLTSTENPIARAGLMSDEGKLYYGSAGQLINAIMRRESGAAISAGEWAMANQRWLPAPGDPPELVAQKRANLTQELEQLKMQAGPAYKGMGKVEGGASPGASPGGGGVEWVRGPDGRPMRKK
jgi:hypothetical protein